MKRHTSSSSECLGFLATPHDYDSKLLHIYEATVMQPPGFGVWGALAGEKCSGFPPCSRPIITIVCACEAQPPQVFCVATEHRQSPAWCPLSDATRATNAALKSHLTQQFKQDSAVSALQLLNHTQLQLCGAEPACPTYITCHSAAHRPKPTDPRCSAPACFPA